MINDPKGMVTIPREDFEWLCQKELFLYILMNQKVLSWNKRTHRTEKIFEREWPKYIAAKYKEVEENNAKIKSKILGPHDSELVY